MAIKEGLQYYNSLSSVIGRPTMKLAGDKDSSQEYASHALVFLLTGDSTR
jgi:hypothetical protein